MCITTTPQPPYYAVIFTSQRSEGDQEGYGNMAEKMMKLAARQEGFIGAESVRDAGGMGITVSYWCSIEAVEQFKKQSLHVEAQREGKTCWYSEFGLRVCKVERDTFL